MLSKVTLTLQLHLYDRQKKSIRVESKIEWGESLGKTGHCTAAVVLKGR